MPLPVSRIVAVIEDDSAMRQAIRRVLQAEDYEPELFETAEDFLASGAASRARCLVVDIGLPGMSGIDLYLHLHSRGSDTPTVFVTAQDETRMVGLPRGTRVHLLIKPFPGEALIEAVEGRYPEIH